MPIGTVNMTRKRVVGIKDDNVNFNKLRLVMEGVDAGDADPNTNNGQIAQVMTITPVATLTKTIVDGAETACLAATDENGDTPLVRVTDQIDVKQAAQAAPADPVREVIDYGSLAP